MKPFTLAGLACALVALACQSTSDASASGRSQPAQPASAPVESAAASQDPTDAEPAGLVVSPLHPAPEMHDISQGSTSALTDARHVLIQRPEHWDALWSAHVANLIPRPVPPVIDFDEWMVVGVVLGQRNSGGYRVEIESCGLAGGALIVEAVETRPTPGMPTTMALTSPFHFVRVPRAEVGVEFRSRVAGAER